MYKLRYIFLRLAFYESPSAVWRQLTNDYSRAVREWDREIDYILERIYELQAVSYNIYDIQVVMNETAYRLHLVKFVAGVQRSQACSHTTHRNARRRALSTEQFSSTL